MMTLYHTPGSCSLAVKTVLNLVGAEYEEQHIDLANKPEYFLQINPLGKVPALSVNGSVLLEGGAILSWLAEKYPEVGLMPAPGSIESALAKRWLFFVYATLHPAWSRVVVPARVSSDVEMARQLAEKEVNSYMDLIASQLEKTPYLSGETPALPDYYLLVCIHWEAYLSASLLKRLPVLEAFKKRMLSNPTVASSIDSDFMAKAS